MCVCLSRLVVKAQNSGEISLKKMRARAIGVIKDEKNLHVSRDPILIVVQALDGNSCDAWVAAFMVSCLVFLVHECLLQS